MEDTSSFQSNEQLSVADTVKELKECLKRGATGQGAPEDARLYTVYRKRLRDAPDVFGLLPEFVRGMSALSDALEFIKRKHDTYKARRLFLSEAFARAIERAEARDLVSETTSISEILRRFDEDVVYRAWMKALQRCDNDPEGAITMARTLIEAVCKHILDASPGQSYAEHDDLPDLWHRVAILLNLAPSQHQERTFKTILGNCQTIVDNLCNLRNRIGDAHGQGRRPVRPKARHARLAVGLAGTMATFIAETWQERFGARSNNTG